METEHGVEPAGDARRVAVEDRRVRLAEEDAERRRGVIPVVDDRGAERAAHPGARREEDDVVAHEQADVAAEQSAAVERAAACAREEREAPPARAMQRAPTHPKAQRLARRARRREARLGHVVEVRRLERALDVAAESVARAHGPRVHRRRARAQARPERALDARAAVREDLWRVEQHRAQRRRHRLRHAAARDRGEERGSASHGSFARQTAAPGLPLVVQYANVPALARTALAAPASDPRLLPVRPRSARPPHRARRTPRDKSPRSRCGRLGGRDHAIRSPNAGRLGPRLAHVLAVAAAVFVGAFGPELEDAVRERLARNGDRATRRASCLRSPRAPR